MFGFDNFRSKKIRYKKHNIQTYSYGNGDKKILALPSFPHSGVIYLNLLKFRPDSNVQIVTFDLPGWIGKTDNIFNPNHFSFEECIKVCEHVLRDYQFDKYSILGFSFGTALETLLAYAHFDRVQRLVYVSPVINSMLDRSDSMIKLIERLYQFGTAKPLRFYIKRRFDKIYKNILLNEGLPIQFLEEYGQLILRSDPTVLLDSVHQLFNVNLTYQYKKLRHKPVMVLNSRTENPLFKKNARLIRTLATHHQNIFLEGRHEDFLLKPDMQTCLKVLDFLEATHH